MNTKQNLEKVGTLDKKCFKNGLYKEHKELTLLRDLVSLNMGGNTRGIFRSLQTPRSKSVLRL